MVLLAIVLAPGLLSLDKSGLVPDRFVHKPWLYSGGGTGARALLGAVAASTIGVAGTVFSTTIAALSLGAFLGTFSYAPMVLRSVRTEDEGAFTPHLSPSGALLLAFLCVGTLVFFIGHMAGRISVETVWSQPVLCTRSFAHLAVRSPIRPRLALCGRDWPNNPARHGCYLIGGVGRRLSPGGSTKSYSSRNQGALKPAGAPAVVACGAKRATRVRITLNVTSLCRCSASSAKT